MMDRPIVREGDWIRWRGKSGDVIAEVRKTGRGDLAAFTDANHCVQLRVLSGFSVKRLTVAVSGVPADYGNAPAYTVDDAPVLF